MEKGKSAFPDMPKCEEFKRELGYSILDGSENFYTNVLIGGKKQKDISFDDVAKDFITIYLTKYNEYGNLETNQIVLSIKELQAINKKCKELRLDMIETETGKVLNKLAREQFKSKLENLNPKEYIEELKQENEQLKSELGYTRKLNYKGNHIPRID